MRTRILILLLFIAACIIFIPGYSFAEELTIDEMLKKKTDFSVQADIIYPDNSSGTPVVQDVCTIEITSEEIAEGEPITINYFFDKNFVLEEKNQMLPYTFKRSYRGRKKGLHTLTFVITDSLDRIGRVDIAIQVDK